MPRILFMPSGATYLVLKDGTRYATGYWAEEFACPYKILTDAGHEITVATPNGNTPNVDMMSMRPAFAGGEQGALELEAIIRDAEVLRRPIRLSDVRLEDYDALYLPGGHGPLQDMAFDPDAGRLLTAQLASGKPLAIVCHAPAAMLATRIHGKSPFKGYKVTCFTNDEEEAVGLASRVQWLLEDELKDKVGVQFSRGPMWEPYTVEDRNLITGQNPHSSSVVAEKLLKVLGAGTQVPAQSQRQTVPAHSSLSIAGQRASPQRYAALAESRSPVVPRPGIEESPVGDQDPPARSTFVFGGCIDRGRADAERR